MTNIYLDMKTYSHIIDTSFVKVRITAIPEFINQSPSIDTNVWTRKILRIVYIMRATDAQKWALDQLISAHAKVTLWDNTYDVGGDVFPHKIDAEYEGDLDWALPWRIELTLLGGREGSWEGSYSNWSSYDNFCDPDANNTHAYQTASINDAETEALLIDASGTKVKRYNFATKQLTTIVSDVQYPYFIDTEHFGVKTIFGTYMVFLWTTGVSPINCDRLSVVKDGVVIKTYTNTDLGILGERIRSASISPYGKWIVVSGWLSGSNCMGWVIIEADLP